MVAVICIYIYVCVWLCVYIYVYIYIYVYFIAWWISTWCHWFSTQQCSERHRWDPWGSWTSTFRSHPTWSDTTKRRIRHVGGEWSVFNGRELVVPGHLENRFVGWASPKLQRGIRWNPDSTCYRDSWQESHALICTCFHIGSQGPWALKRGEPKTSIDPLEDPPLIGSPCVNAGDS